MKHLLDRAFNLLSVPKSKIHPGYKEELDKCEKQLIDIWNKVSNSPTQPDTQSLKPQSQMPQPYLTNQVHDVKVRQSTGTILKVLVNHLLTFVRTRLVFLFNRKPLVKFKFSMPTC